MQPRPAPRKRQRPKRKPAPPPLPRELLARLYGDPNRKHIAKLLDS